MCLFVYVCIYTCTQHTNITQTHTHSNLEPVKSREGLLGSQFTDIYKVHIEGSFKKALSMEGIH